MAKEISRKFRPAQRDWFIEVEDDYGVVSHLYLSVSAMCKGCGRPTATGNHGKVDVNAVVKEHLHTLEREVESHIEMLEEHDIAEVEHGGRRIPVAHLKDRMAKAKERREAGAFETKAVTRDKPRKCEPCEPNAKGKS